MLPETMNEGSRATFLKTNTMTQKITDAYNAWQKAESKIPRYEYEKGYKSRQATARRLWRVFSDECKADGLKPVEVAWTFAPKSLKA